MGKMNSLRELVVVVSTGTLWTGRENGQPSLTPVHLDKT